MRRKQGASEMHKTEPTAWVLQVCHGYDGPFLDCARQYAALFQGTSCKVCTVFLTGQASDEVARAAASDEVIFLGLTSRQISGLKLRAVSRLREIVASRRFLFCIAHRAKPIYVALLGSKLPVIGVIHAFGVYARRSRRLFANLFRSRLSLLAVSDAVRDDLRASLPDWPLERIETLHNRIDLDAARARLFSREEAREALGLELEAWVLGNVGRLHPDKDQTTLIRAFAAALPDLPPTSTLAIMGSGRLEAELKRLSQDLGVESRVRFLGQVPEASRYFRAFDVFALTSDHEPFGMVLLEAMVADVPVFATDCGGAPEVLGAAGAFFPLRDAAQLAELLRRQTGSASVLAEEGQRRLQRLFSDQAARERFFSLPMVCGLESKGWSRW